MQLWGGNYDASPDRTFWEFNRSFGFDRRLLREEIAASRAFARALGRAAAIPSADAARLDAGLAEVLARAEADPRYLDIDAEDVHSFVETRLGEIVGDLAGQGHLGRSRNEQAVTALRLWIRGAIDGMTRSTGALVDALVAQGLAGADAVMPGYTHIRAAEPITFGHLAGAHAWALLRDADRLCDARRRVDVLPLGSGALAGTAIPLDREALATDLGFARVSENALDAVMDRDFASEFVFVAAQLQTHLARLAEDLIWFSAPEFGFVRLPDAFTSGSSLMPQKKNPDALELVRGKTARVCSDLGLLLSLMKGLPAGYQKDLQEDKEAVFDAADTTAGSIVVMTGVIAGLGLNTDAMRRHAEREELMAAGLAVALARNGIPFRKAHALVGSLVAEAQATGASLRATAARILPAHAPEVAARLDAVFDPAQAVAAKAVRGGTAPAAVRVSLEAARAQARTLMP
jgi:argininosuccinate lyase